MSRYTLLASNAAGSNNSQDLHLEPRDSQERDPEDLREPYKAPALTDSQRQLIGLLVFIWMFFLYVTLRFMEATSLGYRPSLLATTNILLDTPDLYHDLTMPLLEMANRTKLITRRCGTRALAPHLLSFLDPGQLLTVQCPPPSSPSSTPGEDTDQVNSDGQRQRGACIAKDLIAQQQDHRLSPSSLLTAQPPPPAFPPRYLLALLVTNNAARILPDLLTRILEVMAILGPENCHLSIVESGTTDNSRDLLEFAAKFLTEHNARLDASHSNTKHQRQDPAIAPEQLVEDAMRKIEFTLVTLGAHDRSADEDSNAYWSRLRKRVLEPLTSSPANLVALPGTPSWPQFNSVVFVQEALTCADDILEMIYQSHLQDADMTCGMTWMMSPRKEPPVFTLKTGQSPRDILGAPLTVPLKSMSADKDTMDMFEMRHPFQASCCDWRQGAVVRAEILMQQAPKEEASEASKCEDHVDVDLAFCEQEYEMLETLDAEGLWSKTDQEHRDEIETRLIRASHQHTYGYRKSAAHYEYAARPSAESVDEEGDPKGDDIDGGEQQQQQEQQSEDTSPPLTQIAGSRLLRSKVAFGAQDIEQGNAVKAKKEQIMTWRASSLCPNK
ncbi:capsular associated protein [Actinomortierella ambigua]|uniref:Capsular associated protein n=1 Tax=Actinomortierella ambigua TaxID=1343610 RepID=A0A9P6UCN1_9FUNG|nr:capsular associated protein [Actinomortierella ambigua]